MRNIIFIITSILMSTSLDAKGYDEKLLETCVSINVVIHSIAKESYEKNISARNTDMYKQIHLKLDGLKLGKETVEYIANTSDIFRGKAKPSLILPILGYECQGMDTYIRNNDGKMITVLGNACNFTPPGTETECLDRFFNHILKSLSPDKRRKAFNDAKNILDANHKKLETAREIYKTTH